MSLNKNVSLINDNFQSRAISKLKTGRLLNHQVESMNNLESRYQYTWSIFVLWFSYWPPHWQTIFKWGQVTIEIYWPLESEFQLFFPALWVEAHAIILSWSMCYISFKVISESCTRVYSTVSELSFTRTLIWVHSDLIILRTQVRVMFQLCLKKNIIDNYHEMYKS